MWKDKNFTDNNLWFSNYSCLLLLGNDRRPTPVSAYNEVLSRFAFLYINTHSFLNILSTENYNYHNKSELVVKVTIKRHSQLTAYSPIMQ